MKRKLIAAIFLIVVVTCGFAFSACGLIDAILGNDDNSPHEHQYIEIVVEPTCVGQGYTSHYCEGCGNTYKDTYTEIDPSKHNFRDGNCIYCNEMQETEGLNYTINEDNESYAVSGIGTVNRTFIKIPSIYNGKPVTSIGNGAFIECVSLTNITLPDSITSIGNGAFIECVSIVSMTIPDGVTAIGMNAFKNCERLTSINIPGSVATIEYCTFFKCESLKNVTISNGVTTIDDNSFLDCTSLVSITLPDSVTSIGYHAFGNCTSLETITIPDNIASIDGKAFEYCTSLTSIIFDGTVSAWKKVANFNVFHTLIGDYTVYCTDGEIAKDGTVTKK